MPNLVNANPRAQQEETYRPVIRFTTRDGRHVRYESIVSSYPPRHSACDVVRILYDPARPDRVIFLAAFAAKAARAIHLNL